MREPFVLTSHSGSQHHPPFQRSEFPLSPHANFGPQATRGITSPSLSNIYTPELNSSHTQILQPSAHSSPSMILSLPHHNYTALSPNNISLSPTAPSYLEITYLRITVSQSDHPPTPISKTHLLSKRTFRTLNRVEDCPRSERFVHPVTLQPALTPASETHLLSERTFGTLDRADNRPGSERFVCPPTPQPTPSTRFPARSRSDDNEIPALAPTFPHRAATSPPP